eukprot:9060002-Alexandrium_andersonii.AAC.1
MWVGSCCHVGGPLWADCWAVLGRLHSRRAAASTLSVGAGWDLAPRLDGASLGRPCSWALLAAVQL